MYDSYLINKDVFITTRMLETMKEIYINTKELNFVDPTIGAIPLLGLNNTSSEGFQNYMKQKNNGGINK